MTPSPGFSGTAEPSLFDRSSGDDLDALRARLTTVASELLLRAGAHGVTVGDLRYSAENRGLLTGEESLSRMNALRLGSVMTEAGGFATETYRRSKVRAAKRSLNVVYVTREFVDVVAA